MHQLPELGRLLDGEWPVEPGEQGRHPVESFGAQSDPDPPGLGVLDPREAARQAIATRALLNLFTPVTPEASATFGTRA